MTTAELVAQPRHPRAGRMSSQPFATDNRFCFVYHDSNKARSVRLLHGLAGYRHAPEFHRVGRGVLGLELFAPTVNRIEYRFQIHDEDGSTVIVDPLNPLRTSDPFSEKSVMLSEGYASPLHIAPPPPQARGSLTQCTLPSPTKGETWNTFIWQPPHHHNQPLPLLVFLDGSDYLRFSSLRSIIENLIHEHKLPRFRAAFIAPSQRNSEYSANPDTAAHLTSAIPNELATLIPMPTDPQQRIGIGASLGGLCLLHAHTLHPNFFGKLLLQSGSYFQPATDSMEKNFPHFDRITQFVAAILTDASLHLQPIPIQLTCGKGGENLNNNRIMHHALQSRGFHINLIEHPDAHNWTSWRDCIGDALINLMR